MASNGHPPSESEAKVSRSRIEMAVAALLKWKKTQSESQKAQLLPDDDFMYLILTLKTLPPKETSRTNPYKVPLPHPLHDSSQLCLIVDDRPKSNLTSADAKKKIKSESIPVSKVIKISKLKTDYKPFEAKRKLCDSYDLFFADKRVIPLLPRMLGKQFFKKKKLPLTVDLTHKNWKEQIERGCSSALLFLKTGTCSVVRVAKVSMEEEEVVENVVAAIEGVVGFVPKGWAAVRSLHLKCSESVSLPVYQTVPDIKLKIEGVKDRVVEDGDGKVVVNAESKKDGNLKGKKGSKKGRIHEVRYMDATAGDNLDDNVVVKSEIDDLGTVELAKKKKKKKGDDVKEKEEKKERKGKKTRKVEKSGSDDAEDDNEAKKSKNDAVKVKKSHRKKNDGKGEEKMCNDILNSIEESGKKSEKKKRLKDTDTELKVKKSKKKMSAE